MYQSYSNGVWMWQGAQCSLLEYCLTKISCPRHMTWYSTKSYYYSSSFLMLSTKGNSSYYHFKVFGMTQLGIEPTTPFPPPPPPPSPITKQMLYQLSHCASTFVNIVLPVTDNCPSWISHWVCKHGGPEWLGPSLSAFTKADALPTESLCQYFCAHSFASNWQLPFLNQPLSL